MGEVIQLKAIKRERDSRRFDLHRTAMWRVSKLDPHRDAEFIEDLNWAFDEYDKERPEPPRVS